MTKLRLIKETPREEIIQQICDYFGATKCVLVLEKPVYAHGLKDSGSFTMPIYSNVLRIEELLLLSSAVSSTAHQLAWQNEKEDL